MWEQEKIRCTIMRGGTSKGIFINKGDLPSDKILQDRIILALFGSPDIRQIDGLGGAQIQTSKVAIMGPPTIKDADVDYTFGQVQLETDRIDYSINCGNISSAVGVYAIEERMVAIKEPITEVRIHNTNTNKILNARVEVRDGQPAVEGNFQIDTVPGTGAKIELDFKNTSGAATGSLLPSGNAVDKIDVEGLGEIPVSVVDCANIVVFIHSSTVGLAGTESTPEVRDNKELMEKLEKIRLAVAFEFGLIERIQDGTEVSPLRPIIATVSKSDSYSDYVTGKLWHSAEYDFLSRVFFNQQTADGYPGTGTICATVAAMIDGTTVNQVVSQPAKENGIVRLGYPRGVNTVEVRVINKNERYIVEKAIINRTARRLMDGYAYFRKSRIYNK